MKQLILLGVLVGLTVWVIRLRRQLQAAEMRGDMYRDISARLDQRLAEATPPSPAAGG